MRALSLAALSAALLLTSLPVSGQSLADAAAKEKERRKAAKGKTYTESDLGKPGGGNYNAPPGSAAASEPAAPAAAPAGTAGAAGAAKEKGAEEVRAEQEKAWRQRVQQAQNDIAKAQQQIDTLQRSLSDLSGNLYGASRTQQLTQLEQAQKQLATSRQQLSDLEEEGRRNAWR